MQYFQSMCHYGIISCTNPINIGLTNIFQMVTGFDLDSNQKSLHIHIMKNSNARIRDWIQDRGVVTITQIVTDPEINLYIL